MSRSNNMEIKNPATRFLQWSGDNGNFHFYDKEKGERVSVELPITFLVLDILSTVKGFSDADGCGYWSNEVRDLKKEILIVKNKNGERERGLYAEISKSKKIIGSKYCQSVYIAYKDDGDELCLGNLQLMGSALSAWIDFRKATDVYKGAVSVNKSIEAKKGKTVYRVPIFESQEVSAATEAEARKLEDILNVYLARYFRNAQPDVAVAVEREIPAEVPAKHYKGKY